MNSFINNVRNWFKQSSFGVILTSVALLFVVCVGVIVNNSNKENEVAKPINSFETFDSMTSTESEKDNKKETINYPFTIDAKISIYYFDSSDPIDVKSQAMINYENKFIPSLGVAYTNDNRTFVVVSSFKGKVVEKTNDALYGLTVVIESEEGLQAHYCGLSDISVRINEEVKQGQTIGKSGKSVINASIGNHLFFALKHNDNYINPLKAYNKTIDNFVK